MMIELHDLVEYCDRLLAVERFPDYCPNGLQVEGRAQVGRLLVGVTASQALIDAAVAAGVDAILVHHGFFWKGEAQPIVGIKARRIGALMRAGISLLAYHLPLDAHPELGNNKQLADLLGLQVAGGFGRAGEAEIGLHGHLPDPMSGEQLARRIRQRLDRDPLHIAACPRPLRKLAWCTGGAQNYFEAAIALGVDGFITGEISEPCYHLALEHGVDFFAAGHNATERYGVQALAQHVSSRFNLQCTFFELENPA